MIAIPKRTFLLRQEHDRKGNVVDVIACKGVKIELTKKEAQSHINSIELTDKDKSELFKKDK